MTLRRKLVTVFFAVSFFSVFITSAAALWVFNGWFEKVRFEYMRSLGDVIVWNSIPPLLFMDKASADETTQIFKEVKRVSSIYLYDKEGSLFSSYERASLTHPEFELSVVEGGEQNYMSYQVNGNYSRATFSIRNNEELLGWVVISFDDTWYNSAYSYMYKLFFLSLLATLLVVFVLSNKLSDSFSRPISSLISLMLEVTNKKNFSVRGSTQGLGGEVQKLYLGFNDMLNEIQDRDKELALYRDSLEDEVSDRTEKLQIANKNLERTVSELAEAMNAAKEANDAKDIFLATVSHEMRTPLHGVLGMSRIMRSSNLSDSQLNLLDKITRSGEILLSLINQVLDFSKLNSGVFEIDHQAFTIKSVKSECYDLFVDMANNKGLHFEVTYSGEIDETAALMGDRIRVCQVLFNVIGNAFKFTETGGVRVVISSALNDNDGLCQLVFRVQDTGIGIPADKYDYIFDPFVQVDRGVARKYEGTGLGLSISKKLALLMGGEVNLECSDRHGSTFVFSLSLGVGEDATNSEFDDIDSVEVLPGRQIAEGCRVLVAEDNILNREVLVSMLREMNCIVESVDNGQQVLDVLDEKQFDLLLIDFHMPEMDGVTTTRKIRASEKLWSSIVIYAVTGDVSAGVVDKCMAAGMNGYLSKPFSDKDLVRLFREIVCMNPL